LFQALRDNLRRVAWHFKVNMLAHLTDGVYPLGSP